MNSIRLSVIFVIVGFIGIAGSSYGGVIDNDYVLGFSLALAVVGFTISLGFVVEAMNKEYKQRKKDERKE